MNNGNNGEIPVKKAPLGGVNPLLMIILVLLTVFFTYQILGGIIGLIVSGTERDVNYMRLAITFAQYMFILAPVLFLNMLQGNNVKTAFRLRMPVIPVFILAAAGIIILQPFLQMIMYYQNEIILNMPLGSEYVRKVKEFIDILEKETLKIVTSYSLLEFIVVTFVVAVTPAVCEEFMFRGIILTNFEKITKIWKAFLFTGLIFAVFHFHPFNLIPLILLGFYLAFVTYYSRSIFTAIFVHFLNNLISALAVYVYGREILESSPMSASEHLQLISAGVISFALFILIIIAIIRLFNKSASNV